MKTVLISGQQGSGKTRLVKGLSTELIRHQLLPWSLKFADPLYLCHDTIYQVLEPWGVQKTSAKDGELLQLIGTEWGRKKDPNIWVNIARKRVEDMAAQTAELAPGFTRIALIDDLRFPNEFDAFPDGFKIRLQASEAVRQSRAEYWRVNTAHPSETGLDDETRFDLFLDTEAFDVQQTLDEAVKHIVEWACKNTSVP